MSNTAKRHRTRRHTRVSSTNSRVPSLRHHKATGQGYVVLNGKQQKYHQVIAEWLTAGKQLPGNPEHITIKELVARFYVHARQYYRTVTDGRVKEIEQFRLAFRPLRELYDLTPAAEFGPRALKTVRKRMIDMGWCRPYINKQLNRIRHMFKWAVGDELVPGHVLHALQAVPGLRKGRGDAREPEPVKPVPMELVEAVEPFVSRQVWAMIQLQLLTGARSGELTIMRPCDIDRSAKVWLYQPRCHKTTHHGHHRRIYIGPKAQKVLAPFLLRDPESYCFSPAEAVIDQRQRLHQRRQTYLSCGNVPGSNVKDEPRRSPGQRYTTCSYRRAIQRACDQGFPPPEALARREGETKAQWRKRLTKKQKKELAAWRRAHRWHPHQLRHNYATEVRREFGLEAAQILLGHTKADVTQIYAERDMDRAATVAAKIGKIG